MTENVKNKTDELSQNDLITQLILSNVPTLTSGDVYLAKDLIGLAVWETLSKGMRISLGSVIFELVENRLLPLTYVGNSKSNKCMYRLH
jgi:hypothetical protein